MPGLKLFVSNSLEILAKKLADELFTPLSSPLKKELIVVQSKGMERWISMELARYHGICANYSFPFPNAMIYELFRLIIPTLSEDSVFNQKVLVWKIMKLLPTCLTKPGFKPLRAYVGNEVDSLKCFQISERIAHTFDQYLVFRPEMILNWEKGKESHWQANLWRMIIQNKEEPHLAALRKDFLKKVKVSHPAKNTLPERISVFGISYLPPFHMEIIEAISKITPVALFLMNPCREYWGEIVSDREARKLEKKYKRRQGASETLFLEKGNSLLASWGILGKQFFDGIYNFNFEEHECFKEPTRDGFLFSIQSDILNLQERKPEEKQTITNQDRSIELHSCHTMMREVEVLHDNILAMFEEIPELLPKDILVMAPDIESYTPFIQGVFDTPESDTQKIPYTIADRNVKSESSIINTLLALLDLKESRFGASHVINILESKSVYPKFNLSETDLDIIKHWVDQSGIRWGIDEKNREHLGFPHFGENTWQFGINRFLLGYALPSKEEHSFQGILSYDHIEGSDAQVLGNFLTFLEDIFSLVTSFETARTLSEWATTFQQALNEFFLFDESNEREIMFLRSLLTNFSTIQKKSGFDGIIDLPAFRSYLQRQFEKEGFGFGFISGGVTFCTMLPMRSIPFKVICLLGMHNDAYPRKSGHLSFDLIAKHPRPGDRSQRNDDRYLFLETILSARKKLYISYIGQNIQDNTMIPPSVVVSELLDYIEQGYALSEGNIIDHVLTKHRLQAFNPEYFEKGGRLFSYSKDNYVAARVSLETHKNPQPFIAHGLPLHDKSWRNIELEALVKFFSNSAKFLLNQRLGIYLDKKTSILSEREPFELKGLEKYVVEQELLKKSLSGHNLKKFLQVYKASGKIPPGTLGECLYQNSQGAVEKFVKTVRPYIEGESMRPIELDLRLSNFRLTGKIINIFKKRLVHFRYAKVTAKDRLGLWLTHLPFNILRGASQSHPSILIAEDAILTYLPAKKSNEILLNLLDIYRQGLFKPLRFFPETSWAYSHSLLVQKRTKADSLGKAREKWEGSEYQRGECEDPYFKLCFEKVNPLDAEFERIAQAIFAPMVKHEELHG